VFIQRVIIENYRCLKSANVSLNEKLNVIVGNNECGKSTLLEAIHLAMTGQLNGRPLLVELHPYLFNLDLVEAYIEALETPPSVCSLLLVNSHQEFSGLCFGILN
jgi:putative ATP-dependent endonuclease of OLD family